MDYGKRGTASGVATAEFWQEPSASASRRRPRVTATGRPSTLIGRCSARDEAGFADRNPGSPPNDLQSSDCGRALRICQPLSVSSLAFTMLCCGSTAVDVREPMARCVFCNASSENGFNIVFQVSRTTVHSGELHLMCLTRTKITLPSRTALLLPSIISS
jgi:hypothetical protein